MATFLQTNLESSILFLQLEHAATLKALHEEIAKLQKKCSQLSLRLALNDFPKDDPMNNLQSLDLEERLSLSEKKNQEMEIQLHDKTAELQEMKNKLATVENEKEFELKMKSRQISSLEHELESKAKTVLDLMAKLHSMKMKEAEALLATSDNIDVSTKAVLKSSEKCVSVNPNCSSKQTNKNASNERPVYVLRSAGIKIGTNSDVKTDSTQSSGSPSISYLLRNRTKKSIPVSSSNSGSEDSSLTSKAERTSGSAGSSPRETDFTTPMPPKDAAPKMRRYSHVKTPVTANEKFGADLGSRSAGSNRAWSASRKSVSSAEHVVPDPSPFLASKSPQIDRAKVLNKKLKLLPPIPAKKNSQLSKDAFVENVGRNESESGAVRKSSDLPRLAMGCVAEVEVLSIDKSDQLEVQQHMTKYKSANCN